jgi:hypothetical protein
MINFEGKSERGPGAVTLREGSGRFSRNGIIPSSV